jgi:hypothetical protein
MSIERIRLMGLQDRRLEAGAKRNRSTSTRESDISQRARAMKGMMKTATELTMQIEGSHSPDTADLKEQAEAGLRLIYHDVVAGGGTLWAFKQLVADNVSLEKKKAADAEADARLAEETESERLAFMGERPVIKRDAFGL